MVHCVYRDPDEMSHCVALYLGLHCLLTSHQYRNVQPTMGAIGLYMGLESPSPPLHCTYELQTQKAHNLKQIMLSELDQ